MALLADDDASRGLVPRSDKPELIDLRIAKESLVDRASGVDFSTYMLCKLPYRRMRRKTAFNGSARIGPFFLTLPLWDDTWQQAAPFGSL